MNEETITLHEYTEAVASATGSSPSAGAPGSGKSAPRRYPGPYSSDEPSPFASSPLASLDIAPAASEDMFNARDPHYAIMHERPEHRVICYLKAQGLSNKEIAEQTGFSAVAVSNIVRQPWARQRIVDAIKSAGQDAVESVLKGAALDSVFRLIEERDNENARPSERIAAANALLDRTFGKPTQPLQHSVGKLDELSDEELARIATSGTETASTS